MLARYLRPVVDAFSDWRDEERWLRPTAPLVDRSPPWLSWSALIRDASDFSRAVVVAHVGATGEPVVRSVNE